MGARPHGPSRTKQRITSDSVFAADEGIDFLGEHISTMVFLNSFEVLANLQPLKFATAMRLSDLREA